ncbi:hypothetical protein F511_07958 [Dorcoceras hygrometricum]|uniref:Protodermal factor 1 n=1 Tax=Dorcoceras hygrometricum TaxID=472368 RepID=A0A2Z7CF71_9LAMI|nr:hypothetical protein F511_07958 [Dorcoceras hygrometricum]
MDSRMGKMRNMQAPLLLWAAAFALLLSGNLVIPVMSFEEQKNSYVPTPPTGNHLFSFAFSSIHPAHGSGGGHATPTPTPSHGGGHATPTPTPSHGGGGYGGAPPVNCVPAPTTPTTPTPPTGGGAGGGYYNPPPTSIPGPTPTTPTLPIGSPPTIPIIGPGVPTTPGITVPSPPYSFTPVSPPFTCIYWSTNPALIWGLFGWLGTVGSTFGVTSLPGLGANMNLLQALSNTRRDGFGELYRQGTAAFLNSAADPRFPYTTKQVRDRFVAALSSNKAAATQARLFKLANEGKTKTRA